MEKDVNGLRRMCKINIAALRGYIFILPALSFIVLLSVYPMLVSFQMAFTDTGGSFVGIKHFVRVSRDPLFSKAFVNTLCFVSASVVMYVVLGLALAILLDQPLNRYYRVVMRTLIMVSWAMPPAVVAIIWRLVFHPQLSFLRAFGFTGGWWSLLTRPQTSLLGVIMANVWFALPFYMLIIAAGLQTVPKTLYEAAAVDGANIVQQFFYITLPAIRHLLVTVAIFATIGCFTLFELVFLMTRGGPVNSSEVLATYIYKTAFMRFDLSGAAAMATIMFVSMLAICLFLYLLAGRER